MIYFISDFHFGHNNILKFERTQFTNIKQHDEYIIQEYNKVVKNNDTCYILGDIGAAGFGVSKEYLKDIFKRLNGRKILVLGNHDSYSIDYYKNLEGVIEVYNYPVFIAKRIVLSHEPIKIDDEILNIHGHLHGAVLNLPNHYNVSAHVINYRPVSLKTMQGGILSKIPKDDKRFLYEWYAPYYNSLIERSDIVKKEDGQIDIEKTRILIKERKEKAKLEKLNKENSSQYFFNKGR